MRKASSIAAGALHGFETGAGLALYDAPLRDGKRLGKARVIEGTAATSLAALDPDADIRFGTDVWVEVEEPAISFTFRVARPANSGGVDATRVNQLIDRAKDASSRRALAIELVGPDEPADLRLTLDGGRLWAVPEGQPLIKDFDRPGTSISLDLGLGDAAFAGGLRRILWSMARASNLVRIASAGRDGAERVADHRRCRHQPRGRPRPTRRTKSVRAPRRHNGRRTKSSRPRFRWRRVTATPSP